MSDIIKGLADAGLGVASVLALVIVVWRQLDTINAVSQMLKIMSDSIQENTHATNASTELIKELGLLLRSEQYNKKD